MQKLLTDDTVCKDSESKVVPSEGMVNHNVIDMTINVGYEDYVIHNPMQVRVAANYPQFEFFQHTGQSGPHPVTYQSAPHWNIQQTDITGNSITAATHDSRTW